jgi:hypothetical protein
MMNGEMARIYMKSGKQEMGLLLNNVEEPNAFDEGVKFIPQQNVGSWLHSFSQELIQILDSEQVDGIDLFMK